MIMEDKDRDTLVIYCAECNEEYQIYSGDEDYCPECGGTDVGELE